MDDMAQKIQSILSDEESMGQIMKLAQMLGAEESGGNSQAPDISSIFGGGDNSQSENNTSTDGGLGFDMSKIASLAQIMQQANQRDKNTDFLIALKPLLKTESQTKIDRVTKIFKLMAVWPLIKESGILGGDLFDVL